MITEEFLILINKNGILEDIFEIEKLKNIFKVIF